ncbi:MAG TPA: tyrosine-type recombinase/integrase [Opitutaceae bacterium]|nr:tyrosine-type recombinase/integrase [Opitutaceae bacterium]HND62658.1 tyrosine-type recombinase/integrase [Opitutaceae bacterium]
MARHSKPASNDAKDGPFQKVAECLYRRRSSGVYYALVKRAGKQYRRSLKTTDRKLAERSLSEFRQKVGGLDHTKTRSNLTFAEVAKHWLSTVIPQLKASSARRRETSISQLLPYFGSIPVRHVTASTCESWAAKRGVGISASTYNNERDTIIAVLNFAKREGLLIENPAHVLRRRKMGKARIVIPSKDEFRKLVAKLRGQDDRSRHAANLVELLAYSGMRLAEATSVLWGDVDFENSRFVVTGGELKTKNHEARIVPLFPALRHFLERLRAENHPEAGDRVIGIDNAKTAMRSSCTSAELPQFTHHCMRHYFVSNAIEAGIDFKTIAAWVGHRDGGLLVATCQVKQSLSKGFSFEYRPNPRILAI